MNTGNMFNNLKGGLINYDKRNIKYRLEGNKKNGRTCIGTRLHGYFEDGPQWMLMCWDNDQVTYDEMGYRSRWGCIDRTEYHDKKEYKLQADKY